MHIASVAVFEGPAPRLRRHRRRWSGPSSPSFPATGRSSASSPSTSAGRSGWTTSTSTSTTTSATPLCRRPEASANCASSSAGSCRNRSTGPGPSGRSGWSKASTVVGGHCSRRPITPWSTGSPAPTSWRSSWTSPRSRSAPPTRRLGAGPGPDRRWSLARALVDLLRSPYEQFRAVRASTRVPRQALRQLVEVAGASPPWPASSGPPRSPASTARSAPPPLRLGLDHGRRHQGGPQEPRGDLQRRRPGCHHQRLPATCCSSRGESVDRVVRTLVPVSVRARDTTGRAVGDGTFENKVSAMFAELPVGIDDPVERLRCHHAPRWTA